MTNITIGASGPEISKLQTVLNKKDADNHLIADGIFGEVTALATLADPTIQAAIQALIVSGDTVTPPVVTPPVTQPGANPGPLKGIDIYDEDNVISWSQIKESGISFCFMKASQGTTDTQSTYRGRLAAARSIGIVCGAYHFVDFSKTGVDQANHFVAALNAAGGLLPTDLPPVLDWEYGDNESPKIADVEQALAFLETVEKLTGRKPMIYMSASLPDELGNPSWLTNYPLWVAEYGVSAPKLKAPYASWQFWQTSGSATVQGLNQAKQDDIDTFPGSMSDLEAFIASSIVKP